MAHYRETTQMKGYLVVTGTIFGLVGVARAARLFVAPRGRSA